MIFVDKELVSELAQLMLIFYSKVSNDTEQTLLKRNVNWKQFDMFLSNKAGLYGVLWDRLFLVSVEAMPLVSYRPAVRILCLIPIEAEPIASKILNVDVDWTVQIENSLSSMKI